jgi:hypothetical protein
MSSPMLASSTLLGPSDSKSCTNYLIINYYLTSHSSDREFLGMHRGSPQSANLGDGNGWVNEHFELRQSYPILGTGLETLIGGKHFRLVTSY